MPAGQNVIPQEEVAEKRRPRALALLVALRPQQWVKNLFVGAPLLFAKSLFAPGEARRAAAAVGIFCLIASAVYLWNDLVDLEKDRVHPRKRRRPIAAGELPVPMARVLAASLASFGLAFAWVLAGSFALAAGGYLMLNVAYSLRLKRVPYLDVLAIASGFLLRVVAGALAIEVHASPYLLLCTALLACFVGFGKRAHELASAGERGAAQRSVLALYRPGHLRVALYLTGAATVVAYVAYTLSEHTRTFFHTTKMVWTVPAIIFGMGRFLVLVSQRPRAESPTEELLRDPLFMANLGLWVAAVIGIIYFAH
ncbi:MAG TPA: decaprenyl-phosphate phosphoribosyltransferase [Polyangia bacterium]|nr:decaprenyl-phosphate phosphoribosyltransferase [Polyangia bacterium]